MPALLIYCKVTDYATWQSNFDEEEPVRRTHGCLFSRTFRNASDPEELLIFLEWDTIERAQLYAQSDEFWNELRREEVMGEGKLWFLNETE